ncbi:MAG: DUF4279 domain-containing protein [Planctomycetota bacterium]|nr:MAG: DUF4279 domain-containing protein [Planctomycetota bacterium]
MTMVKKANRSTNKRFPDTFRYVFLALWAKDLDPDSVTKALGIEPDSSCRRGLIRGRDGKVIKDKRGRPKRTSAGEWIIEEHAHGNSGFENRIKSIIQKLEPKKTALRRLLKKVNAVLIIVVQPHEELYTRSIFLPASILNEFTSLGIDIEFRVDNPQKWAEFWRKIEKKSGKASQKKRVTLQKKKGSQK